jgi:ribosomal protein S10
LYRRDVKLEESSAVEFDGPRQAIYHKVPTDFVAFYKEVDKAFGGQWAPRSAFEELFNWYLEKMPKRKLAIAKLAEEHSDDYMTNYMLDAIEGGGMKFIVSLGEEWTPLLELLQRLPLNQRRSFACKLLYQRMQEVRLEEMKLSIQKPKPFQRQTKPKTQSELLDEYWDENLPQNVRDVYHTPRRLKAPYGVKVAQMQIRGYYMSPVEFYADFCARAAYYFGLPCAGPVPLPVNTRRWTVVRAPFVFKKTQETFERKTFSRLLTIKDGHPDVVEMWISYCHRHTMAGTALKVQLFTNDYIGVGRTMSEDIKQLIETDRWGIDGYNDLSDDATRLKNTVDKELVRLEAQIAERDEAARSQRVLQQRVNKLLALEEGAYIEAEREFEVQQENARLSGQDPNAVLPEPEADSRMNALDNDLEQLDIDDLENMAPFSSSLEEKLDSEKEDEEIIRIDFKNLLEEERKEFEERVAKDGIGESESQGKDLIPLASQNGEIKTDENGNPIEKEEESKFTEEEEDEIAKIVNRKLEPFFSRLKPFEVIDLQREVDWDKYQDDALRQHFLRLAIYAEQKGIGSLTREEYFSYVPHVLLPKYQGIHRDVFAEVENRGMLRVPMSNSGYLNKWHEMSEAQRFEAVMEHRQGAEAWERRQVKEFTGDVRSTSRLEKILKRKKEVLKKKEAGESELPEPVTPLSSGDVLEEQRIDEGSGLETSSPTQGESISLEAGIELEKGASVNGETVATNDTNPEDCLEEEAKLEEDLKEDVKGLDEKDEPAEVEAASSDTVTPSEPDKKE